VFWGEKGARSPEENSRSFSVTIYGDLVHNEQILDDLKKRDLP
jgi:4-hydroxy-3-methylbut-2-enyl diphosphate reductase IspH